MMGFPRDLVAAKRNGLSDVPTRGALVVVGQAGSAEAGDFDA